MTQWIRSSVSLLTIFALILLVTAGTFAQNSAADVAAPASGPAGIKLDTGYRPPVSTEGGSLLYDNGPLINNPGGGVGGADESVLQSVTLSMVILGFGHQISTNNHIADDFTITDDSWTVDSLIFWAYQTNSGTTSTITEVRYQIWDGSPDDPGSTILFGDLTTNRLTATTWDNLYRVSETTLMTTARPVMKNTVSGGFTLPQGTYWIEWTTGGSLGSGPWAPPITINGMTSTGNALQWLATAWAPVNDVGQQGFPFQLHGTASGSMDPIINVTPLTISETLTPNDSIDVTVTVNNLGTADLDWAAAITSSAMQGRVLVRHDDESTVRVIAEETGAARGVVPTVSGTSSKTSTFTPPLETEVLYDQTGSVVTGSGYTSQDFEASSDAFDNQGADDFVIPGGETWNINQVSAYGVYYNGFGPMPSANVYFYADAGGSPGALLDSRPLVTTTTDVGGSIVLDFADVTLGAGTYWISVQARMDFTVGGQWGWSPNAVQTGAVSHWQNPGNGFSTGCITWGTASACIAQIEPDYAFILCGTTGAGGGDLEWISLVGTTAGTITPGNSATFDVRLRGVASSTGGDTTYTGTIEITSNDPTAPSVIIDVTLMVSAANPEIQMSLTHTPGSLNMGIFNDGSIGTEQVGFLGPGITWNGAPGCFVGGPIFGTSEVGAVNGLIGSFAIFGDLVNVSSNFAGGFTSDADFDQIASADLDDSGAAVPYGVKILQRSYSNTGEEAGFIRYGYVNNSGDDLTDFYSGIFLDWDIDDYLTNSGGYDVSRNLIYQFDGVGPNPYFGLIALDGMSGGRATTDTPPGSVQAGSFEYITTSDFTILANGDFRSWIGAGPSNLDPGDTTWASYAVVAGDDLAGLLANADAAIAKATAVGWIGTTGVGQPVAEIPAEFGLSQNYPNPFNPTTRITYALPQDASVTLRVYDVLGQEVVTLENSVQQAGLHEVTWNGRNTLGQSVGSGVYFYRLEANGTSGESFSNLKKMLFLK